ncbi:Glutamate receptor ionotropic, delta-1 [Nymphon striatum]|nr:Glutamate receptor ionotropic, delta-1 [Nymphon striatum]
MLLYLTMSTACNLFYMHCHSSIAVTICHLCDKHNMKLANTNNRVAIYEMFHSYIIDETKIEIIGKWESTKGLTTKKAVEECCHNISGAVINIVTIEHEPFVKIEQRGPQLIISGICLEMMNAMKKAADFEFSVYEAPDGQFGRLNKGRWNGMIGEVINKRADMAMASFTPSAERMEFVDFTSPFVEGYLAIFYKMTKPVPNSLKNYVTAFAKNFFILIFLSYFVLSLIWAFTYRDHLERSWKSVFLVVSDACFLIFQALSQQSATDNLCTKTSTKVNLVTLYIFTSFVISCYTSVLVSFMTVTSSELPFTNIDELINNPNYGVAFVAGTIEPESAKASSSLSEGVWANIMSNPNNFVQTYKEGVIKAVEEPIGFVTFSHLISPLPDISSNTILDKEVKSTDAMVFSKNSPFYSSINKLLMELKESGVLSRILNKYLKESDLNQDTDKSGIVQVVGIIHSWFTFAALCVGVANCVKMATDQPDMDIDSVHSEHKRLTSVQKIMMAVFSATICVGGMSFSVMASYLPQNAYTKGLTTTDVGIVFAMFAVATLIFTFIFSYIMHFTESRLIHLTSTFICAGSLLPFAFVMYAKEGTPFYASCLVCRFMQGVGFVGIQISTFSIVTQEFSDYLSTFVGILEMAFGVGFSIGPSLGGFVYDVAGFEMPFFIVSGLLYVFNVIGFFTIKPQNSNKTSLNNEKSINALILIKIPELLIPMGFCMLTIIMFTFIDVSLGPLFTETLKSTNTIAGLGFGLNAALYAGSAVLIGYLVDKKRCHHVIQIIGSVFGIIAFLIYGPIPGLGLDPNLIGPILGGILIDKTGVGYSGLVLCILCASMAILNIVHFIVLTVKSRNSDEEYDTPSSFHLEIQS